MTRNAVLASPEHGIKASLRSATMMPRLAIVDPELTYSLPPAVTASTGLDALTIVVLYRIGRRVGGESLRGAAARGGRRQGG